MALMIPPRSGVRVRMYRQGLGDCFLLAFPCPEGGAVYMLIDCGVVLGTPEADKVMKAVARDIGDATGGHLHVLVATHEHWDHLSGFLQAEEIFQGFSIDHIWLAWTEDPRDREAQRWRSRRRQLVQALRAASLRLAAADPATAQRVTGFLDFFGGPLGPLAAAGRRGTEEALRVLKQRPDARISYHRPGQLLPLPGAPSVRVYVLGPPRKESFIRRSRPTKRGKEVYASDLDRETEAEFLAAFAFAMSGDEPSPVPEDDELVTGGSPFKERYRIPVEQARTRPYFKVNYGFDPQDAQAWRRVDDDWLGVSEQVALQLNSDTNNTSLALALELVDSGKVLIFPGDAQVGSWLSWEELRWKSGSEPPTSIQDLFARTVLYKVSHHASHNATLREKGLEGMSHPDLVAMIPVDQSMAEKKHWDMPFPPLLQRLTEKTNGRILRSDMSLESLRTRRPPDVLRSTWDDFLRHLSTDDEDALFVEYEIAGD